MAGVHTCTATVGVNMTAPQETGNLLTSRPSSSFRNVFHCSELIWTSLVFVFLYDFLNLFSGSVKNNSRNLKTSTL